MDKIKFIGIICINAAAGIIAVHLITSLYFFNFAFIIRNFKNSQHGIGSHSVSLHASYTGVKNGAKRTRPLKPISDDN